MTLDNFFKFPKYEPKFEKVEFWFTNYLILAKNKLSMAICIVKTPIYLNILVTVIGLGRY